MMRSRSKEQLCFIVMAGGGLNISARGWSTDELRFSAMAAAGSSHKPRLIFRDLHGRSDEDLRFIAMAGQGCVIFSDEGEG
jgi:hypothetical protein